MTIKEPICEEYELEVANHRTRVVQQAYVRLPERLRMLLPEFEVISTMTPFGEIDDIVDSLEAGNENEGDRSDPKDPEFWDDVVVFALIDDGGTHTIFVGGDESAAYDDDMLAKAFTRELVEFAWRNSPDLRAHALHLAARYRGGIDEEMCLELLREGVTGLVYYPRTLKRQNEYLHDFIVTMNSDLERMNIEAEPVAIPA